MMETNTLKHTDVEITYAVSKCAGTKSWLTLILPFGFEVTTALPFFSYFSDKYNLLTWQARQILAPPQVEVEASKLTVQDHASDLLALLEHLDITRTDLVGYCSGAGIALGALSMRQEKFNRVALVNGEFVMLDDKRAVTQYGGDIDSILPLAAKDFTTAAFILQRMPMVAQQNVEGVDFDIMKPFSAAKYFHRYAMNYVNYRNCRFEELAKNIDKETLILAGGKDLQTNVYSAEVIHQCIPHAEFIIESEADHYGILRASSPILAHIDDFLDEELQYAC